MESFRCIQVSRLLLDEPLHGTGPLGAELRAIVEDATLTACERIIEQCLARQVDCLLISVGAPAGSAPRRSPAKAGTPTLRGAAAFARGLARLQELDVTVVIQAAHSGLWEHWPSGLRLPPNVHRLGPDETGIPVARSGKLLATITYDAGNEADAVAPAWRIDVPSTGEAPKAIRLAESARAIQGIRSGETGPRGCTFVEIDGSGSPRETLLSVAPVRWERFEVAVAAEASRDDLLQEMASLLEGTSRNACEDVWLVSWDVTGAGRLFESLEEPAFREHFLAELSELEPVRNVRIHSREMRLRELRPDAATILPSPPGSGVGGEGNVDSPLPSPPAPLPGGEGREEHATPRDILASDFTVRMQERFANQEGALADCLAGSALRGGPWEVRLESLLAELDAGEVAHDACRTAMHWFAGPEELSS